MPRYAVLFLWICAIALSSCSDHESTISGDARTDSEKYDCIIPPPDTIIPVENAVPEVTTECYRFDKGEEHKSIVLNTAPDSAWGNFQWRIEGKDGVTGEFSGQFHGDTLWIMYQAVMEGHLIPREVAFLKKGDKLYEAQGTQEEGPQGIYYYQHKKLLEYSDPEPMVKGPCM